MGSEQSALKAKRAGSMRLPSEGNSLWALYHQLPRMQQREFKEAIRQQPFTFNTFLRDTERVRALDLVPFGRLDFYRTFFMRYGFSNLLDVARQERTTPAL